MAVAAAADRQGNYAIWGAGGQSCHQFALSDQDVSKTAPYRDYLMGYLTAFNAFAPDTYDATGGVTLEATLTWLRRYCDAHAMDSFERAVGQMLLTQHAARTRLPPGTSAGWGDARAPPGRP